MAGLLGLVVTWIAYPLVVAALAALSRRRPAPPPLPDLPSVSVVIASRETPSSIAARVCEILTNGYPADRMQIVVALDIPGGAASKEEVGETPDNLLVVESRHETGKAAALNVGVAAATNDVLIFTDTFQKFRPHAIERLVRAAMPTGVGAVSGRLLLPRENRAESLPILGYWAYETWLRRNEAKLFSGLGVFGPIWAMRRECWQPLPKGLILDDLYTPMRLMLDGFRTDFCDDAVAIDLRPQQPAREFRRKVRTLTGNLQLVAWLPDTLVPGRNPVWLQYVLHKLMRLLTPYFLLMSLGIVVPGVAFVLGVPGLRAPMVALALIGSLGLVLSSKLRRVAKALMLWMASMQVAMVAATYYGLRGEWNVWRR
jgi:cellulose synthase/poly-beta-1,6-N-acetylglucosamine synthase-like glycosyltransferase